MRTMILSEKLVINRQKRNLMQMHEQIKDSDLNNSVVRQIYHPESSRLLKTFLKNKGDGLWKKKSYIPYSPDCERRIAKHLATLSSRENTVLCFFPNYSPRGDDVISDLPALEVLAGTIDKWYEFAKTRELHFFLCSSHDLREGIALDFYEADPVVHDTAGAVLDVYFWSPTGCLTG